MSDDKKPRRKRLYCNQCRGTTNHELRGEHKQHESQDDDRGNLIYWIETTYRLWTCLGCDTGTLEIAQTGDSWQDENGNPQYSYSYCPDRQTNAISRKFFRKLPSGLRTIYSEVIEALNKRLHLL